MIFPVPGEHDWTRTPGPDIEPPAFKIKRGRRKEKRIKGKFEVPKPKETSRMGTITCGNCGLQGHRYTNCLKQLKPELALRKNKHVATPSTSQPRAAGPSTAPTARQPRPAASAPTPPSSGRRGAGRGAGATSTTTPPSGRGRGVGRGRGAVTSTTPPPSGRGAGRGRGRAGRGAPMPFIAPRKYADIPTDGTHTGWMSYFTASMGGGGAV
ncbi:hypothetical protein ACQJBY_023671 [Aegilops geniculata]